MISVRGEQGLTLVELLVAMIISMIVMGSVVFILTVFLHDNRYDQLRDDATADARSLVDRLSHDLRSAAAPSAGSSGLLAVANPYDIAFQSVDATPGTAPSGDPTNQVWVRYCLDGSLTLWRQSTSPASTTSTLPSTSACPSTDSAWTPKSGGQPCCVELSDATNEIGGDNRPLFTYGPSGYADSTQIKSVQVNLYVDRNPGHLPGPTELTSGIYLRNELAPPVSNFVAIKTQVTSGSQTGTDIKLNGSPSSDPNGQVLSYQWYSGVNCPSTTQAPSSGAIPGATTQQFDDGIQWTNGSYTFALAVTNTGGLTSCSYQTVTVP